MSIGVHGVNILVGLVYLEDEGVLCNFDVVDAVEVEDGADEGLVLLPAL